MIKWEGLIRNPGTLIPLSWCSCLYRLVGSGARCVAAADPPAVHVKGNTVVFHSDKWALRSVYRPPQSQRFPLIKCQPQILISTPDRWCGLQNTSLKPVETLNALTTPSSYHSHTHTHTHPHYSFHFHYRLRLQVCGLELIGLIFDGIIPYMPISSWGLLNKTLAGRGH